MYRPLAVYVWRSRRRFCKNPHRNGKLSAQIIVNTITTHSLPVRGFVKSTLMSLPHPTCDFCTQCTTTLASRSPQERQEGGMHETRPTITLRAAEDTGTAYRCVTVQTTETGDWRFRHMSSSLSLSLLKISQRLVQPRGA